MSNLANIKKGVQKRPFFIGIHGGAGVGKTTFASNAPEPLFLTTEDGTDQMDVARLEISSFMNLISVLNELLTDKEYKTIIIDSADHLETMVHKLVAFDQNKKSIEEIGYAKGYIFALEYWNQMLSAIKGLRNHGKNVILIGHSQIKKFNDPVENESYDRFELKLHAKASALLTESMDALLFAKHEVLVKKDSTTKKIKAIGDGSRLLYTEARPAFDAKNRYGLPAEMPLSWNEFEKYALRTNDEKCLVLLEKIKEKLKEINNPEYEKTVMDWVNKNSSDLGKLEETLTRINEK